ncbi:uncharacterized protein TNCV_3576211 [Trichonephila clavipes]|nr:uncharacterized protein TNCV_3576211 [Trichonephila clavipes]
MSGRGPRNSPRQKDRCTPVVSHTFEHHTGESTSLARLHPNFKEHPRDCQGTPKSIPLSPTSRKDLGLEGYLEYPYAAKALYIYKHSCLLRDSNPGPTAQQTVLLITMLDLRQLL